MFALDDPRALCAQVIHCDWSKIFNIKARLLSEVNMADGLRGEFSKHGELGKRQGNDLQDLWIKFIF